MYMPKSPPPTDKPPSYSATDPNAPSDLSCRPTLKPIPLTVSLIDLTPAGLAQVPPVAFELNDQGGLQRKADGTPKLVPFRYTATDSAGGRAVGPVIIAKRKENGEPVLDDPEELKIGMLRLSDGHVLLDDKHAAIVFPRELFMQPRLDSTVLQVFNSNGDQLMYRAKVGVLSPYCQALSPVTRLILENAGVSATTGYGNSASFGNALLKNPGAELTTTATNTYLLGVGYTNKPILKQLRALVLPADSRYSVSKQGTFWEDFLFNAVTMNASYGWGRTLEVKGGMPIDTYNSRPAYNVSVTYALDLERMYIYAMHGGSRPADQGYYYGPTKSGYFEDPKETFFDVPGTDYSWPDKAP